MKKTTTDTTITLPVPIVRSRPAALLDTMLDAGGDFLEAASCFCRQIMPQASTDSTPINWEDGHLWIGLT